MSQRVVFSLLRVFDLALASLSAPGSGASVMKTGLYPTYSKELALTARAERHS